MVGWKLELWIIDRRNAKGLNARPNVVYTFNLLASEPMNDLYICYTQIDYWNVDNHRRWELCSHFAKLPGVKWFFRNIDNIGGHNVILIIQIHSMKLNDFADASRRNFSYERA